MTLSTESAERIALLYRAARTNGALVSLEELARLLPEHTTEEELADAIASTPLLRSMFEVRSGFLTEHLEGASDPLPREALNRSTASKNLVQAADFVARLHSSGFGMVAVSGSTSYGSASLSKDIDLFCVAPTGRMWASLVRALLMARAYGILHRGRPVICLSCVMDEDYACSAFESRRDSLFARDAIQAKVLKGQGIYQSLMERAPWISKLYPVAYRKAARRGARANLGRPTRPDRILNRLIFETAGRYIRVKSSFLNRRLGSGSRFEVHCTESHLMYESRRYLALRDEYDSVLRSREMP